MVCSPIHSSTLAGFACGRFAAMVGLRKTANFPCHYQEYTMYVSIPDLPLPSLWTMRSAISSPAAPYCPSGHSLVPYLVLLTLPFRKEYGSACSRRKVARQPSHTHRDGTAVSVRSKTRVEWLTNVAHIYFIGPPMLSKSSHNRCLLFWQTSLFKHCILKHIPFGYVACRVGTRASRLQTAPETHA